MTADHIIVGDEDVAGRGKQRVSLAVLDRGTGWIGSFPAKQHTASDTFTALQEFAGPREPVKLLYTDGAPEYKEAAEKLGWIHQRSTPYRPQTNGVAERNVQRIVQGTRAVLQQSGMDHCWWPEASECYCFLHNVADTLRDEKTPHELRHGHNFLGMKIPFGSLISFKPSGPSAKKIPKFAPRTVEGLFMGYHLHAGGKWSGDYYVISRTSYEEKDAERDIYLKRVKEVFPSAPLKFPIKDGTLRRPHQELGREEIHAAQPVKLERAAHAEVKQEIKREEEEKPAVHPDTWELRGMLIVRVHRTPRLKLFVPTEDPEDPPPIPIDEIDVCRSTTTSSEMQNEKRIEDVWYGPNADRQLSELWTGETVFDPIPPPCEPGYMWCNGRKTRIQQTQRPPNIWRESWEIMSKKQ